MARETIRLEESDIALAAQLTTAMGGEPPAEAPELAELLSDRRNIVIACLDGSDPVGYLVAHQFPSLSGDRLVYLYDIEVAASHRRQGIATAMVERLLGVCRAHEVSSIWVGSSVDNQAACALWERTGAVRESDRYVEFTYRLG